MKWYWKVRIYESYGHYWYAEIVTVRNLFEIALWLKNYEELTGCKMLIEGMRDTSFECASIHEAFESLWRSKHVPEDNAA